MSVHVCDMFLNLLQGVNGFFSSYFNPDVQHPLDFHH